MSIDITVMIPFVQVDPDQNPNMRAKGLESSLAYFRAMAVTFASIRRFHPNINLELVSDREPPRDIASTFDYLRVRTRIISFDHRPPSHFTKVFEGSLFLLDALDHAQADCTIIVDPDVLFVRPLDGMLGELGGRAGAVRIDYSEEQNINGLSRAQAVELHGLLGEPVTDPPQHMGGEFYVIPRDLLEEVRDRVRRAWELSLLRFGQGETRFTTEEHILTLALRGLPFMELNGFVRRIWTAHSFRNVTANDFSLMAWHLPAEKNRGFAQIYASVTDTSSWFWTSSDEDFVITAAKIMGLRKRNLTRLALGLAGHAARRVREARTPIHERAAG